MCVCCMLVKTLVVRVMSGPVFVLFFVSWVSKTTTCVAIAVYSVSSQATIALERAQRVTISSRPYTMIVAFSEKLMRRQTTEPSPRCSLSVGTVVNVIKTN